VQEYSRLYLSDSQLNLHVILISRLSGRLAQLGEHGVRNAGVVGSNPMPSTNPIPLTPFDFRTLIFSCAVYVPNFMEQSSNSGLSASTPLQ
jgi:hypothetical protein